MTKTEKVNFQHQFDFFNNLEKYKNCCKFDNFVEILFFKCNIQNVFFLNLVKIVIFVEF